MELKLITPISITGSHFETKKHGGYLGFFKNVYISRLKSYRVEIRQYLAIFGGRYQSGNTVPVMVPIWEYCPSVGTNLEILSKYWYQSGNIVPVLVPIWEYCPSVIVIKVTKSYIALRYNWVPFLLWRKHKTY